MAKKKELKKIIKAQKNEIFKLAKELEEAREYIDTMFAIMELASQLDSKEEEIVPVNSNNVIRKVIFSNLDTIIFWEDDTKTRVRCENKEDYSPSVGFLNAFCKKFGHENGFNFQSFVDEQLKNASYDGFAEPFKPIGDSDKKAKDSEPNSETTQNESIPLDSETAQNESIDETSTDMPADS